MVRDWSGYMGFYCFFLVLREKGRIPHPLSLDRRGRTLRNAKSMKFFFPLLPRINDITSV